MKSLVYKTPVNTEGELVNRINATSLALRTDKEIIQQIITVQAIKRAQLCYDNNGVDILKIFCNTKFSIILILI